MPVDLTDLAMRWELARTHEHLADIAVDFIPDVLDELAKLRKIAEAAERHEKGLGRYNDVLIALSQWRGGGDGAG